MVYRLEIEPGQAETGQPIYFWNPLLKAVVLQKPDFLVLPFILYAVHARVF